MGSHASSSISSRSPAPPAGYYSTTSPVGTAGGVVSGMAFETVTVREVAVVWFPAASRATAERVWEPLVVWVVSQVMLYGLVVSSLPRFAPSRVNCTPETATLSEAVGGVGRPKKRGEQHLTWSVDAIPRASSQSPDNSPDSRVRPYSRDRPS